MRVYTNPDIKGVELSGALQNVTEGLIVARRMPREQADAIGRRMLETVSYTHLDVYKRQPYRVLHSLHPGRLRCHRRAVEGCVQQGRPAQHSLPQHGDGNGAAQDGGNVVHGTDVYKRQPEGFD